LKAVKKLQKLQKLALIIKLPLICFHWKLQQDDITDSRHTRHWN